MDLTLWPGFTEEQRQQFGPVRERTVLETRRHVYTTPFMYGNVEVGHFYEIDPTKGIEFKGDDGFLTVREESLICAVAVVGSGCTPGGYNVCEWWEEGESIDTMQDQLVKRQRVDGLNGIHPSIWCQLLMRTYKNLPHLGGRDLTFDDVAPEEMRDDVECLRKLSEGYYQGVAMGFYENTAHFLVGPPYPRKVTVRCGCKGIEDPGTSIERYPADYAIRVVEVTVVV
jgi:hypothetical protein